MHNPRPASLWQWPTTVSPKQKPPTYPSGGFRRALNNSINQSINLSLLTLHTQYTMSDDLIIPDNVLERIEGQHPSLIGSAKDGRRQISLTLLTPPSSSSSRSVSSSSTTSTAAERPARYITIPTHLKSSATFEFFGFTPNRAAKLYERLASKIPSERLCVLEWALNWVEHICADIQDSTDNWDFAMEQAGIKDEIKTAFADPKHSHILHIQSLSCWLSEIIETSFNALIDLSDKLLTELSRPQTSLQGSGDDPYTVPQAPSGHISLFKSVEYARCQGCISEDGTVDLSRLQSTGPTDFCHRGGLYFTHQMWVATHYSALINDACPVADRRTVEIHVPLAHFQSAKMWELQFEDAEFKQLLFYSRREERYPKDLSKKRSNYGVINAPICHAHNKAFGKMKSWTEITSKHQLQSKEEDQTQVNVARQHVWIREEAVTQLEEDIFGKVYLRKPEQGFRLIPQPWLDVSAAVKG
ncbi:hypothetical protein BDU57DRAFT_515415 [Ampelomyces quisqualis]|uniref:Uncharacterized protein n=1 Tax=Ampelomyces quisqualis TaxID=50730 RepID=A0A6A5QS93_AMPQU|nr:hypothetical protein BDU57DRAFT_515415 [Ampelomyces quisqualis]